MLDFNNLSVRRVIMHNIIAKEPNRDTATTEYELNLFTVDPSVVDTIKQRLIDAAGLKGTRIGGAVISERHANFFINDANATAADMKTLIEHARRTVAEKLGVQLELEIEVLGEWDDTNIDQISEGNRSN